MDLIPVVILAGRPSARDKLMNYADVDNKVLIEYSGKRIIDTVVEAVLPIASYIILVGIDPFPLPASSIPIKFLSMEGEQYDKIFAAITHLHEKPELFENKRHALFLSGDIPLLRTEIVAEFLYKCNNNKCADNEYFDFYYSLVPEYIFFEQAPTLHWTYMKIKDGSYASGNLILLDPSTVVDKYDMIKFLSTNRKSFALGVLRASPILFIKLILGRIRLSDAEQLMTKMFKISSKLIIMEHFEVAFDLDLPEHLDWLLNL